MTFRVKAEEPYTDPNGVLKWRPVTLVLSSQGEGYEFYNHGTLESKQPQPASSATGEPKCRRKENA